MPPVRSHWRRSHNKYSIQFLYWNRLSPHAFTDDAGMSKHRLPPHNACYHNWQTLNFTASDSSSDDRCFLKVIRHVRKNQQNHPDFTRLKIHNSADPHFTGGPLGQCRIKFVSVKQWHIFETIPFLFRSFHCSLLISGVTRAVFIKLHRATQVATPR